MTPIQLPYDEAVRKARRSASDRRYSFVARVTTPWIVLGVEAWLLRTQAHGIGELLITPSTVGGNAVFDSPLTKNPAVHVTIVAPRTNVSRLPTNIRRLRSAPAYARLLSRGRTDAPPIDIVCARDVDTGFLLDLAEPLLTRDVRIHLIDEGFGRLPVFLKTDLRPNLNNARLRSRGSRLRFAAVLGTARAQVFMARLAERQLPCEEHSLIRWDERTRKSTIDVAIRDSYRTVLALRPRVILDRGGRPLAVLATQPLSDYLSMSAQTESAITEYAVRTLVDAGFDVLIKPHPRERPSKYDDLCKRMTPHARSITETIPSEVVFRALTQGDVVVGYTGQSLLSANALYDLPAYSLTSTLARFEVDRALLDDCRLYDEALPLDTIRQFDAFLTS